MSGAFLAVAAGLITPQVAIEKSITALEKSRTVYLTERTCFSCHHQLHPTIALATVRDRGFEVNDDLFRQQTELTYNHIDGGRDRYLEGKGQGGGVNTAGSALWALKLAGHKPDETTTAVVSYL